MLSIVNGFALAAAAGGLAGFIEGKFLGRVGKGLILPTTIGALILVALYGLQFAIRGALSS